MEWYDRRGISWVHRFVHDAGELVRVDGLRFDDHELPPDREQAIDELLAVIDRPSSVRVTWDAALRRREDVLPEPHQAFAGLGPPLAEAVVAAVDEVRDRLGPLAFVSFSAAPGWSIDDARLLSVRVADVTYRDRAREVVGDPLEVLSLMAFGEIAGVMEPDAFAHCPENVMQQVRAGLQATARQLEYRGSRRAAADRGDRGSTARPRLGRRRPRVPRRLRRPRPRHPLPTGVLRRRLG